jgi:hypothetical protein
MKDALLKSYGGGKYPIVRQDDNVTVLRIPSTRFGSPEDKDLHDEYFKSTAYFGDDVLSQRVLTFEHFLGPLLNPHAPKSVADQVLGVATNAKTENGSRFMDAEIRRISKYHDYVLALNNEGLLGTSSQTLPGAKRKSEDGGIDDWFEVEVCLTACPADPKTVPAVREKVAALAKSFGLPEPEVAELPVETSIEAPADEAEKPLADQIAEAVAAADTTPVAPVEGEAKSLYAEVQALRQELSTMKAYIWGGIDLHGSPEPGESLADVLKALRELVGSGNTEMKSLLTSTLAKVNDTQKGLVSIAPTLGTVVAEKVRAQLSDLSKRSPAELEAEELAKSRQLRTPIYRSSIPENAPGG